MCVQNKNQYGANIHTSKQLVTGDFMCFDLNRLFHN